MSVDNISHLGTPALDELVPSRYALQVGDIDVLVISDGVLPITGKTIAYNADSADLASWLDDQFLPPDVLEWPLNVVVVRSGERTILVDAGLGLEFPDFPTAGRLARRLEAAGVDLAAVTDVVLTHMHMDHIGGLLGDGLRSRLRPDLQVHVAAAEAEFWESPDFTHTHMPAGGAGRASVGRHAVPGRVPQPAAAVRERSTRWRRGCSPIAPAATPPGTAWSAWRPAATG